MVTNNDIWQFIDFFFQRSFVNGLSLKVEALALKMCHAVNLFDYFEASDL
jgi:hypothetical protein